MAKLKINDYEIEYSDEGNGKPIVFIHGSASDHRTWNKQKDEFKKKFRVITYSRRYHWPNPSISDKAEYSMEEQVNDLEDLLTSLKLTPAHLIGHSYGGFLSLLLAMKRPEYVRTLVMCEPPVLTLFVSNEPKPSEIIKLLFTKPSAALSIIKFGAKGVKPAIQAFKKNKMEDGMKIFGEAILGKEEYSRMPDERKEQTFDNQQNSKAELLGPGFLPLDKEQIRQLRIPSLLVTGQNSINLFYHLTMRLKKLLPDAELTQIPESGHLMHENNPEVFNEKVLKFLHKNNDE